MSELAKRWAVAGVAIPVVVVLLYVGGWPMAVPLAALAALGARELYGIASRGDVTPLVGLGAAMAGGLVLLAAWRSTFAAFAPLALALLGIGVAVALVIALRVRGPTDRPLECVAVTLFGTVYLGMSLAFIPLIHALPDAWSDAWSRGGGSGSPQVGAWDGLLLVALPLGATWLGDAAAFFAGTAWGRGGLAPSISPNKSWVGVWAGLAGAGLAGAIWYLLVTWFMQIPPFVRGSAASLSASVGMGVLVGIAAILGDLVESLLKRSAGVKDSGIFFPGHGGVLDRLDALVFTLPTAYAALVAVAMIAGVAPSPGGP